MVDSIPYAVTHILIPIILVDLVRDHVFKLKRCYLPNKYILLAGLSGLLPDIDMVYPGLHGSVTHSIIFPVAFFLAFLIYYRFKNNRMYKIFLMLFVGFSTHVLLDSTFGRVALFFPFSFEYYGLNFLYEYFSRSYIIYAMIDGSILFLWLIHEELEHKISDYL